MIKSIKDFDVLDKRVLVRCDVNVPVDGQGNILDDFRLQKALDTIKYLMQQKAKIILLGHLGEPEGRYRSDLTLDNVKKKLEELLKIPVKKANECIGKAVEAMIESLKPAEILLLENVRFHKEETDNNAEFAKAMAESADVYINDAFDVCHREHASVVGIPKYIPHGMGLLLQKELENLAKVLHQIERPFVVIMGGAKVKTKVKFIDSISGVADTVLLGGLLQKELIEKGVKLVHQQKIIAPMGELDALDIHEATVRLFCQKIMQAKTVLWNGPLGKFEDSEYSRGTLAVANAIIESKAFSVVGGGDTIEFLEKNNMLDKFSHVSTGGGAMLEFLSGQKLPGLVALE